MVWSFPKRSRRNRGVVGHRQSENAFLNLDKGEDNVPLAVIRSGAILDDGVKLLRAGWKAESRFVPKILSGVEVEGIAVNGYGDLAGRPFTFPFSLELFLGNLLQRRLSRGR